MAVVQIRLADELKAKVEARAAETGYQTVEQYVEALLQADLESGGPQDSELEELLLARLNSGPGIPFTPEFAARFKREVREQRDQAGRGPQ